MLNRVRKTTFFLILFFLSSQVGFHFWPKFAAVSGIRIDYLSPTFYVLDVLIIFLFLFSIPKLSLMFHYVNSAKILKFLLPLFILSLFWNLLAAKSFSAHLFGIIKLIEFTFLGIYTAHFFGKEDLRYFIEVLSLSAIVSCFLAIWQFVNQGSIGGLWYFFGERTFNASTIGISTVNLNGQILRPYAAFPHPNVLAFFLLIVIIFATFRIAHEEKVREKLFLILTVLISSATLVLTFSRTSIFLLFIFFFYIIYSKVKSNLIRFGFLAVVTLLLFGSFFFNLLTPEFLFRGIDFREKLFEQSLFILSSNLYFGVGLNNFFINQAPLIKEISPIIFQPPHNIFILALLELGLFGWWIFPATILFAVRSLIREATIMNHESRDFRKSVLFVLIAIVIAGMFDHFFLTLEQGQIMFALILGLSFTSLKG